MKFQKRTISNTPTYEHTWVGITEKDWHKNFESKKNPSQICQNPKCGRKTNSPHSRYCLRCSIDYAFKVKI